MCTVYKVLEYTPAEVSAGSLLAAWVFSSKRGAARKHLPALADACDSSIERLKGCADDLVEYYKVCFPDARKVFVPIVPDEDNNSYGGTRYDSPDTVMEQDFVAERDSKAVSHPDLEQASVPGTLLVALES